MLKSQIIRLTQKILGAKFECYVSHFQEKIIFLQIY